MKAFVSTLFVLAQVIAFPAFAGVCYPDGGGDGGCLNVGCAPEVMTDNVSRTDHILAGLSTSPEFASATEFRRTVTLISKMPNPGARLTKYLALVGVDSKNQKAIANFVGQREIDPREVSLLMTNTALSKAQAKQLVGSLLQGLRGDLQ